MTVLPIVGRELRVAARRRGTYWTRAGFAVGAVIVGGWLFLIMHRMPPQTIGRGLFIALGVITFIYAAIMGMRVTADCLSEEKRDGTLGLLFLTDLRGYDVVLGKLVANSVHTVYGMLAVIPILAISLLLGGVTYGEFGRVALTALNILFLSLCIGMFSSAVCRDERKTMVMSLALGLAVTFYAPVGAWAWSEMINARADDSVWLFSPLLPCILAMDQPFRGSEFWASTAVTHLYGWFALALACFIVPRTWQEKSRTGRMAAAEQRWVETTQGKAVERRKFRQRLLERNAFSWLVSRDRLKPKLVWGVLAIGAGFWIWIYAANGKDFLDEATYVITALLAHTLLKMWIAAEACRRFVDDRRTGAMELLLSTPLQVKEILSGQLQGLWRQFAGPVLFVIAVDFVFLFAELYTDYRGLDEDWLNLWIAGIAMFIIDLFALSWVGMWTGLVKAKTSRAIGATVSRVLILPWIAFLLLLTAFVFIMELPGLRSTFRSWNFPDYIGFYCWLFVGALNSIFWMNQARRKLYAHFRDIATQRLGAPISKRKRSKVTVPVS